MIKATRPIFYFFVGALLFFFSGCQKTKTKQNRNMLQTNQEEVKYRPKLHFTPTKNWMNDPNGLFYLNGTYHLYFQHHPDSNVWGPMHWGHATSTDLIHWKEHSIALAPDRLGTIFSGSAVVDHQNTSGLGSLENTPIIAIYTNHDAEAAEQGSTTFQTQSIAYSLDEGYTWEKYSNNPVIKNPGIQDFRDPKVIWMESQKKWVLILAAGQETQFYSSKNLIDWNFESRFGEGVGNHEGVWECPDLFPMQIKETGQIKWVHLVSNNPGGPNGGSATQYFIGDFDGKTFTLDPEFKSRIDEKHAYWVDFGRDNYAGVTFANWKDPEGNPLFIGWMSNWQYAPQVPTTGWRSTMTLPRILELVQTNNGPLLRSSLAPDFKSITAKKGTVPEMLLEEKKTVIPPGEIDLSAAQITIHLKELAPTRYTFQLSNSNGETLSFGYDHQKKTFFIDRSASGETRFSPVFAAQQSLAPRFRDDSTLTLKMVLDKTSIELFMDEGETVMTEIFFPQAPYEKVVVSADQKTVTKISAAYIELKPQQE